jgi:hypothetical protein
MSASVPIDRFEVGLWRRDPHIVLGRRIVGPDPTEGVGRDNELGRRRRLSPGAEKDLHDVTPYGVTTGWIT